MCGLVSIADVTLTALATNSRYIAAHSRAQLFARRVAHITREIETSGIK